MRRKSSRESVDIVVFFFVWISWYILLHLFLLPWYADFVFWIIFVCVEVCVLHLYVCVVMC
jgi:hypothetical protein